MEVRHHLVALEDNLADKANILMALAHKALLLRAACEIRSVKFRLALQAQAMHSPPSPCPRVLDSAVRPPMALEIHHLAVLRPLVPSQLVDLEDKVSVDKGRIPPKVLELLHLEAVSLLVRVSLLVPAVDSHSQRVAFHQGQVGFSLVERRPRFLSLPLSRRLCLFLRLLLELLLET